MTNTAPLSSALPFKLVIFDCDGTLVDSEYLNNKAFSDVLTSYGLTQYTPDYLLNTAAGYMVSHTLLQIQMETGFIFPEDTVPRYIRRVEELQQTEMRTIAGVDELVKQAASVMDVCVGSNGERSNVVRSVELAGLKQYFPDERIYTKTQVARGKPAPDLFLFAAAQYGYDPRDCIVIEDSEVGVSAGVAAGMTVIGFTGSSHHPEKHALSLKNAGAHHVVQDFIHIQSILGV